MSMHFRGTLLLAACSALTLNVVCNVTVTANHVFAHSHGKQLAQALTDALAQTPDTPPSKAEGQTQPADSAEHEHPLPKFLEQFRKIKSLEQIRPGIAPSADIIAAFEQTKAQGAKVKDDLVWLLSNAQQPAGRVYAALLLGKVDASAGKQAMAELKADTNLLEVRKGGEVYHFSVAEIIIDALSAKPIMNFDPGTGTIKSH